MNIDLGIVLACLLGLFTLWMAYQMFWKFVEPPSYRTVAIVVLGDIGRSPRMMYHAESFASHDFKTYIVAYKGNDPINSLLEAPLVRWVYMKDTSRFMRYVPRYLWILIAPWKVLRQIWTLLYALLVRLPHPPQYILVQNPPTIPTLALVWLVAKLRGSKVIIDWHNLGYSVLALRLGERHPLVRIAKKFEQVFGRSAYAHLFVTKAMRDHLVKTWDLRGHLVVLHDRPPAHFRRTNITDMHGLFTRLTPLMIDSVQSFLPKYTLPSSSPFTWLQPSSKDQLTLRSDRPALVITSTSWTPDEDFGVLLHALQVYEQRARQLREARLSAQLPKMLMIVTGKGPLRHAYMDKIAKMQMEEQWEFVRCVSLWVEAANYPLLLGSCDLGISLHSSTSALDLPMKIVDMFGCQLPVCALNFACLPELVQDGRNGLIFNNSEELANQVETLLTGFPQARRLEELRRSLDAQERTQSAIREWGTWQQNWDTRIKPLVKEDFKLAADAFLEQVAQRHR